MLETTYEKTKKWGAGSRFILFYLLSISLVSFLFLYKLYYSADFIETLENYTIRANLEEFLSSLFFAPWFETLLYNVFLTSVFYYIKSRPINTIFAVSLIFSISHYQNGILAPMLIFLPALAFSWNYYLYHEKRLYVWGFLSTSILHFAYNFTLCVVIPLICIVLNIYYGVDINIK
jgi:hypothetical protein